MHKLLTALLAGWLAACSASAQTNGPATAAKAEASYTAAIEKRTADILVLLDVKDKGKLARVHDTIIRQYRALKAWHDANDAQLKAAGTDKAKAAEIQASLKTIHAKFIGALTAELSPEQLEKVKDKMTYNKVQVTYDSYMQSNPGLSAAQKARLLEFLKEAREQAMDAGSADEKSAVFRQYKGRINNYLSSEKGESKPKPATTPAPVR